MIFSRCKKRMETKLKFSLMIRISSYIAGNWEETDVVFIDAVFVFTSHEENPKQGNLHVSRGDQLTFR